MQNIPYFILVLSLLEFSGNVEMLEVIRILIHPKAKMELLFTETDQDTDDSSPPATPVIIISQPMVEDQLFTIVCEGVEICSTNSLSRAYFLHQDG